MKQHHKYHNNIYIIMNGLSLLNPNDMENKPNEMENNTDNEEVQKLLGLTIKSNCNNELDYIPIPPACNKEKEDCEQIKCKPLKEFDIQLDKINDIQDPKLLGSGGMNAVIDITCDKELPLALRLTTDPDIKEKESVGLLYQTKLSKSIEEGGYGCQYIAKVYDFGDYTGNFKNHEKGVYGILEKLPMDLFYRATEVPGNVFTEDDIKSMTKQMLEALSCMHRNNIYHFDIKPENIMMCDEENKNIKLIDFGLCYTYDKHSEMPITARGSPSYYSPGFNFRYHKEELNKELTNKIDRRPYPIDDLWALAVIICLITGINIVQDSGITIPIKEKNIIVEKSKNFQGSSYILKFIEHYYDVLYKESINKNGYIMVKDVKYSKECIQFLRRIFDTVDSKTNKPTETFTTLSADDLLDDPWFQEVKETKGGKSRRKRKHKRKTKRRSSKRKTKSKK